MAKKLKIDKEKCKGCMLCIEACPQKALILLEETNKKGHKYIYLDKPDKCTGCGMCIIMCPDCVIEIIEEGKK